jgi:hypothetical protein
MLGSKRDYHIVMSLQGRRPDDNEAAVRRLRESGDGPLDLARIAHGECAQLHAQ